MKRRIAWAVLLVVLGVTLLLASLLGTTTGSSWLLARLPGVAVESFSGRLGGDWQAERLSWTASFTLLSAFAIIGALLYLSLSKYEKKIVRV